MSLSTILQSINHLGVGTRQDPLYQWYQLDCIDGKAKLNRYPISQCTSNELCPTGLPAANVQLYKNCTDEYLNECPRNHPFANCLEIDQETLPKECEYGANATIESWQPRCNQTRAISIACAPAFPPPCPEPSAFPSAPAFHANSQIPVYAGIGAAVGFGAVACAAVLSGLVYKAYQSWHKTDSHPA